MRTLLVLVAAVGLPLCAQAQPAADDGKSTVVSELAVEAHTGECPMPAGLPGPNKMFDAPSDTRNQRTGESVGTRALVLALAADHGDVDYSQVPPKLKKQVQAQFPRFKPFVVCQGAFKGIKFLHVSQDGDDVFEVDFSNGVLEWEAKPFHALQLTYQTGFRYFYPQPASRQFEDWLKSMEEGRPNYEDLTTDSASKLQAQWPALQTSLKDWGRLKGFRFLRQEDDGAYVYLAAYEHRQVVWTASPPNADGKFATLTYSVKAG
jgi:hypothetical protein